MSAEIEKVMADLGIRYDQAWRMVRDRRELARSGYRGNSNWLK